jgi:hypothetical protein
MLCSAQRIGKSMADETEKPRLSVVAQNTRQQIETNDAQQAVNAALIELAANIIRVVRGAGKPEAIVHQCSDLVNAAVDYQDAAGRLPSPAALAAAIQLEREPIDMTIFPGRPEARVPADRKGCIANGSIPAARATSADR